MTSSGNRGSSAQWHTALNFHGSRKIPRGEPTGSPSLSLSKEKNTRRQGVMGETI
jgi:hypothetical protein